MAILFLAVLIGSVLFWLSVVAAARPVSAAQWLDDLAKATSPFGAPSERAGGGSSGATMLVVGLGGFMIAGYLVAFQFVPRLIAASTPLSSSPGWLGPAFELAGATALVFGLIFAGPMTTAARRRHAPGRVRTLRMAGLALIVAGVLLVVGSLLVLQPWNGA